MLEKLEQIEARYEALTEELSLPEVYSDQANYAKLNKQHRSLGEIVSKYREWRTIKEELAGAKELFDLSEDEEMHELARSEMATLEARLAKSDEDLRLLLLPRDPNDEKNVIVEIRAGTGGDEATLFAAEMVRM
ncbi:MAG: PCRF domain-containing protein, partial [Rubrivivax sp.]|nr:PCRF domain-containing protein [Pyrinomonadaceae bacterium]